MERRLGMRIGSFVLGLALILTFAGCLSRQTASRDLWPPSDPNVRVINAREIGTAFVIIGEFGFPVASQTITITGRKDATGPRTDCFFVDTVNGQPIDKTKRIFIPGTENWPGGVKVALRGHECATLQYTTPLSVSLVPVGKVYRSHQTMEVFFYVEEVLSPDNMKLEGALPKPGRPTISSLSTPTNAP